MRVLVRDGAHDLTGGPWRVDSRADGADAVRDPAADPENDTVSRDLAPPISLGPTPAAGAPGPLSGASSTPLQSRAPRAGDGARVAIAPSAGDPTVDAVTYAEHRRQTHRTHALRPVGPAEHPPLPVRPVAPSEETAPSGGRAPGEVVRLETRYVGTLPAMRRVDGSGRVLYDAVADVLGWAPGAPLAVTLGPGHWVTLTPASSSPAPAVRHRVHLDRSGRLVIPLGIRTYLGIETGDEVVLRIQGDALQVSGASLLARALDLLDRVEAAAVGGEDR